MTTFEEKKDPIVVSEETTRSFESETPEALSSEASPEQVAFVAKLFGHDVSAQTELDDREFLIVLGGAFKLSDEHAREIVTETLKEHASDRNFPVELRSWMEKALEVDEKENVEEGVSGSFLLRVCASFMYYSSPYPEVRASTQSWDTGEYCETIRAYIVGIVWVAIGTFVNQFFEVRQPAISLSAGLLQLFSVPTGHLLAFILPDWGVTIRGTRHTLNPGPWSYKEQTLCTIMFGITASLAYVDMQILVQKLPVFYDNEWAGPGFQIVMLLSTQYLGFGIAGLARNILVYPAQNLWMNNFPSLALNKAFLQPDNRDPVHGWRLTRWQFFGIIFAAIFLWEWFPLYLTEFLSTFNWMTWIAPNNVNLALITGSASGMGFNPISTFDWSAINYLTPLQNPFFSFCNLTVGAFVGGLIIIAVYYTNMYNTGYLPINSNHLFTNTGEPFQVQKILTDNVLDREKYQAYSPPYFAAANVVLYGAFFAAYTCLYVTSLIYDYEAMYNSCKDVVLNLFGKGTNIHSYKDTHSRLMQKYKETPQWWFLVVLLISIALAIVTLKAFPTETPVWGLFMALGFSIVFLVPIGVLFSRTNNLMSTNVLVELIIGYAKPGHGTAMMLVKAYGVNSNLQAIYFMNDLKLGHYAKIPPRSAFRVQMLGTLISALVVFGVCQFQLNSVKDICTKALASTTRFTCPNENTYFSASVLWGVIGPKRVFEGQYPVLKWCFLIGCFIPVPLFLVRFFFPKWRKTLLHVEPNSMIMGILNTYAPYNFTYVLSGWYMNFAFMFYVRRRYTKWFEKYNYVMAAALTAGTALSAFIIFFAVQYHDKTINYWGSTVSYDGLDGEGAVLYTIPDDPGYFGPGPGNYNY